MFATNTTIVDKPPHFYSYSYFKLPFAVRILQYSETVRSIMHQEGLEIRKLKRTKSFSPLIKPIIPTKASKTMNRAKKKNYSML